MINKERNTWIIIDHPQQFLLACNISILFTKKYGCKSKLLISKHAYWKNFKMGDYRHLFSKLHWFNRLDYAPPGMKMVKQMAVSLLLFPQLLLLKIRLVLLNINKDDLVFSLSNCTFLESLVVGVHRTYRNVAVLPYREYENWQVTPQQKGFETNAAIKVAQFARKIFAMPEALYKYNRKNPVLNDGDIYLGYKEKLSKVFDSVILTVGNYGGFNKGFRDNNVFLVRYPNLIKSDPVKRSKKMVVFLGGDFMHGTGVDQDASVREINKYLDYIRRLYLGKYPLIYKPHPREVIDGKVLDLRGFKKIDGKKPAEIFFSENRRNIKSVFSVISSASQFPYFVGLDSYLFSNLFPFDKVRRSNYDDMFSVLPPECFINNLKDAPRNINKSRSPNVKDLGEIIKMLVPIK